MKRKYYAVRKGRESQLIVETWEECSRLVVRFPNAEYKAFTRKSSAEAYLKKKKI